MIIKGTEHNSAQNLASYLLREKEGETCRLWEVRDSASDALAKALTDWELIGRCKTKGSKVLYHAHIRVCDDERMNEAQWHEAIENLEKKLGFTNCPRAIVGHDHAEKGLHVHIVWSRYDAERQKLVTLGNDHQHHHGVAREFEKQYGLRPAVDPANDKPRRKRRLSDREIRAIKERGIDRGQLEKRVLAAWTATDSGEEMRDMLQALKIALVPGTRRDWVVEYKGLKLNPVRLLPDVNEARFRARMRDVDVEAEKRKQREADAIKQKEREAEAMNKTVRRKAEELLKPESAAAFVPANDNPRRKRRLSDREIRAIKERGIDRGQLEKRVQAAWAAADSGEEMRVMLQALKIELIPGENRAWTVEYKGLKLSPEQLLPGVNEARFRARMQDVDIDAERQREAEAMKQTFRRKAEELLKQESDTAFLPPPPTPPAAYRPRGPRGPQPRLRPKIRYRDPGI